MRIRLIAVAALLFAASTSTAQSKKVPPPKLEPCDSSAILLTAEPIYKVGNVTIAAVCPTTAARIVSYQHAHPELTAIELVSELVHGKIPTPPGPIPSPTPVPTPVPSPDPAPPVVVSSSWAKLGAGGQLYSFIGLRDVCWTYSTCDAKGSLTATVYALFPCGFQYFGKGPSGGSGNGFCFDGPPKLDTIAVPVKMGPIQTATIIVPKADPGVSGPQVQASGGGGIVTDGSGSERIKCNLAKFAYADPIVFPGQPGKSHLHMFFGNTAMDDSTTAASIVAVGNSTCTGGILNRTAYWVPAMIDANGNVVAPDVTPVYYKTGYNMTPARTQPLPTGLKMVAGDKLATGPQIVPGPQQIVTWLCLNGKGSSPNNATIPACAVGDVVRLTVIFPQCWNGKDLDSPDHKSHMAYPNYAKGVCPDGYPVQVPEVTEHFDWPVVAGAQPSTWHLSSDMDVSKPGGLSAHADWMMGWDPPTMAEFVTGCLQAKLDCEIGGLGKRKLY